MVRAGASPRQKGIFGGCPCASSTRIFPERDSTRWIRHDVLPSRKMSPARLSTAEVFVNGANVDAFRHGHDVEQRGFRNRAAAGDGRKARATSSTQTIVHAVAMNVGTVASALGGDAFREHFKNLVEQLAREIAIGVSPPHQVEKLVFSYSGFE